MTMQYYYSTLLKNTDFEHALELTARELQNEGFGILTQINVRETLKEKIDVEFRPYIILGACNPHFAHKALLAESKLGVFLPCNVVVEQLNDGEIEISAVDPLAMMASVVNPKLEELATEVRQKLQKVIDRIGAESARS